MNIFHAVIFQEWFNEVRIPFWHPTFVEQIDPKNNVQVVVQVIGTIQLKNLLFKLAHLPRHYKNSWTSQTTVPICSSLPPKKQTGVEKQTKPQVCLFSASNLIPCVFPPFLLGVGWWWKQNSSYNLLVAPLLPLELSSWLVNLTAPVTYPPELRV